jgi:hypothetical protein
MGGAYAGKAVAAASSGKPPGWGSWPWPGPWPPGYIPQLSLLPSGPDSVTVDGTASGCEFSLRDQETYRTAEPENDTVVLTAATETTERSLNLKQAGGSYASSIEADYEDIGSSFYGLAMDLVFDTDETDVGDKVVVTATTSPLDQPEVVGVLRIPIVGAEQWHAKFTVDVTYADPPAPGPPWLHYRYYGQALILQKDDTAEPAANISGLFDQKFSTFYSNSASGISDEDVAVFGCYSYEEPSTGQEDYYLGPSSGQKQWILHCHTPDGVDEFTVEFNALSFTQYGGTWDLKFEVYKGDDLQTTTTKQMVKAVGEAIPQFTWLEFNSADGSVTVITP